MQKYIILLVFVISSLISYVSEAGTTTTPICLGLVPPAQFPNSDFSVSGIRATLLWGENRNVKGIDLGLIGNITKQEFSGVGIAGGFNWTQGTTVITGLQLAGLTNINENRASVYGLQAALGANLGRFTDIYGAQLGIYNRANDVYGVQIGIVNVASNLHGIQLGLANFNLHGYFTVSPIINIGF